MHKPLISLTLAAAVGLGAAAYVKRIRTWQRREDQVYDSSGASSQSERAVNARLKTARHSIPQGGDVRIVYYGVLALVSLWGIVALRLTQPIVLLALSANMAGIVFIISALHVLYVNTRLLPLELRPPMWRRLALIALAAFYGLFLAMWLWSLV